LGEKGGGKEGGGGKGGSETRRKKGEIIDRKQGQIDEYY